MRRVLVIGSPGSGKSTLAAELARRTGLPLIHLDQQYWRSGWIEPPKDEWRHRVSELVEGDSWIIDGNYGGTLELRLTRADTVVLLEFRAWICLWRVLRRLAGSRGRVRSDMAEGCAEKLNLEFLLYTATFPFTARRRTLAKLARFKGRIVRLRSPAEARRFLQSLPSRATES